MKDKLHEIILVLVIVLVIIFAFVVFVQPTTVLYRATATIVDRQAHTSCTMVTSTFNKYQQDKVCTTTYAIIAVEDTQPVSFSISKAWYERLQIGEYVEYHVSRGTWIPFTTTHIDGFIELERNR